MTVYARAININFQVRKIFQTDSVFDEAKDINLSICISHFKIILEIVVLEISKQYAKS